MMILLINTDYPMTPDYDKRCSLVYIGDNDLIDLVLNIWTSPCADLINQ